MYFCQGEALSHQFTCVLKYKTVYKYMYMMMFDENTHVSNVINDYWSIFTADLNVVVGMIIMQE